MSRPKIACKWKWCWLKRLLLKLLWLLWRPGPRIACKCKWPWLMQLLLRLLQLLWLLWLLWLLQLIWWLLQLWLQQLLLQSAEAINSLRPQGLRCFMST